MACKTAVYVNNRLTGPDKIRTKYEILTGRIPNVSNLKCFGEDAVIKNYKPKQKFDDKGIMAKIIGYGDHLNTYEFFIPNVNKIIVSCDARFLGTNKPIDPQEKHNNTVVFTEDLLSTNGPRNHISNNYSNHDGIKEFDITFDEVEDTNNESFPKLRIRDDSSIYLEVPKDCVPETTNNENREPTTSSYSRPVTRSMTGENREQLTCNKDTTNNMCLVSVDGNPSTLEEAKNSEEWPDWEAALNKEMSALENNGVVTEVTRHPLMKIVKSMLLFKKKHDLEGKVTTYKVRLVAKGYSQIPGVDFKQTYAPVASLTTIRIFFTLVNQHDLVTSQIDVANAFLNGDLEEELYLLPPKGYNQNQNSVWKLNKSLYGLKQAPRNWNRKFHSFLTKFKLINSELDKCLYYNYDKSIVLVIYVDDAYIAAKNGYQLNQLINYLKMEVDIRTLNGDSFLGLKIDRKDNWLFLSQPHYINKILERFKMTNCNPVPVPSTPDDPNQIEGELLNEEIPYKEAIGCLMYLVTCTRPDIAHAVGLASRTSKPTVRHWEAVKKILRYLRGSIDFGILFKREKNPKLNVWSDADFANDKNTRKSITGFVITLGNTPITWRSAQQPIVALSTTEAEFIAGCEATKELIPIKNILLELELIKDEPTDVFIDNLSSVRLALNENSNQRTKHIDVRLKWLCEQQKKKNINVQHVPGDLQRADILTKSLTKNKFNANRQWLLTTLTLLLAASSAPAKNIITPEAFQNFFRPEFTRAPLVHYELTSIPNLAETNLFNITTIIVNPCSDYFGPDKLLGDIEPLKVCSERFANNTLHKTRFCDKIKLNKTTMRDKRNPSLLLWVGYAILAGSQAMLHTKITHNANNIDILAEDSNKIKEYLVKAHEFNLEVRNSIVAINENLTTLGLNLNHLSEQFGKTSFIVSLGRKLEDQLKNIRKALEEIDDDASDGKASIAFLELNKAHIWSEEVLKWSRFMECKSWLENDNFYFNYVVNVPKHSEELKILKEKSFQFYNQSTSGE